MDRAPFRPLAELGILPPSIVAIQQPSGDQAISVIWSHLTDRYKIADVWGTF